MLMKRRLKIQKLCYISTKTVQKRSFQIKIWGKSVRGSACIYEWISCKSLCVSCISVCVSCISVCVSCISVCVSCISVYVSSISVCVSSISVCVSCIYLCVYPVYLCVCILYICVYPVSYLLLEDGVRITVDSVVQSLLVPILLAYSRSL